MPVESTSLAPGAVAAALRFAMYMTFTNASNSDTVKKSANGNACRVQFRRITYSTPAVTKSSLIAEKMEKGGMCMPLRLMRPAVMPQPRRLNEGSEGCAGERAMGQEVAPLHGVK